MGDHDVDMQSHEQELRSFMRALLRDVRALEVLLDTNSFEVAGRIGAEQEMFLIDPGGRPASKAAEVLADLDDPRFVTELARFNLEANLTPRNFDGKCLSAMEAEMEEVMTLAEEATARHGCEVLLAGILPTLNQDDLGLHNMSPNPRYRALNDAVKALRGGDFHFRIKGLDELELHHDNVMVEAANTSFQIHFQVDPGSFPMMYNLAQAVAGPVLASAVNSPLLLGKRLWQETRVAVFQQSIDARSKGQAARGHRPRVDFGDNWIRNSVLEIFREDIARFRVVLSSAVEEDSLAALQEGKVPSLKALRLHNGTVYRWNRPCYGISPNGQPHLRIEMRALPAGPSLADEVANAAFFYGLLAALSREVGDISRLMEFDDAKANFFAAARHGMAAQLTWVDGKTYPAPMLICDELLPLARNGLADAGIDSADIDRYMGILDDRVRSGQTGASWATRSWVRLGDRVSTDQRVRTITRAIRRNQSLRQPCHTWVSASASDLSDWHHSFQTVSQFMSTDLFTVRPTDLVDLAASLMTWEHIRHVPVEDDQGHLVGLVSNRSLLRLLSEGRGSPDSDPISVSEIMKKSPVTVTPETRTLHAMELMKEHKVGCLPVLKEGKLVGLVTEHDFIEVAAMLLESQLRKGASPTDEVMDALIGDSEAEESPDEPDTTDATSATTADS